MPLGARRPEGGVHCQPEVVRAIATAIAVAQAAIRATVISGAADRICGRAAEVTAAADRVLRRTAVVIGRATDRVATTTAQTATAVDQFRAADAVGHAGAVVTAGSVAGPAAAVCVADFTGSTVAV
jgi:hypothetical protein